jgi:ADP-ribose pyrophosphatase
MQIKVDMSKPENQEPKAQLEEGEFIECFSIPLKDLYLELRNLERQGFAIDGKVGVFAEGYELSRLWS